MKKKPNKYILILCIVIFFLFFNPIFASGWYPSVEGHLGFFDLAFKHDDWISSGSKNSLNLAIRMNDWIKPIVASKNGKFNFEIDGNFYQSGYYNEYIIDLVGELDKSKGYSEYRIDKREISGRIFINNGKIGEVDSIKGFWEGNYNPRNHTLYGRFIANFYLEEDGKIGQLKESKNKGKFRGQSKGIFSVKIFKSNKDKARKIELPHINLIILSGYAAVQKKNGELLMIRNKLNLVFEDNIYIPAGNHARIDYRKPNDKRVITQVRIKPGGRYFIDNYSSNVSNNTDLWVKVNYPNYNFRIVYPLGTIDSENAEYAIQSANKQNLELYVFSGIVRFFDNNQDKIILVRANQKAVILPNGTITGPEKFSPEEIDLWWTEKVPEKKRSIFQQILDLIINLFFQIFNFFKSLIESILRPIINIFNEP